MLEWMLFIVHHLFVHFRISSSLSFKRKTKRHVFLLLFVLTPVHLNWPSYATGKCYRSPRQLISTMKHWWLYITIHSLTIFKWKMRNLRLNLIYLSFFVQYISVSAKFIGPSDRQDKYVIGPICLISSRTEMSDVDSNSMYTVYTQSQTDISSVLWKRESFTRSWWG